MKRTSPFNFFKSFKNSK